MSAMATSYSPLLESALAEAAKLSPDEKAILMSRLSKELNADGATPEWMREELHRREEAMRQGLLKSFEWEEVRSRLHADFPVHES